MNYLKEDLQYLRKCLNLTQENVIVQVLSVAVLTETKTSVVLLFRETLGMSEYLKKSLIGGFSCVNTRLAFDTDITKLSSNEKVLTLMEKTNKKYLVQNFKDGREQPIQYGHDKTITVWLYQKNI